MSSATGISARVRRSCLAVAVISGAGAARGPFRGEDTAAVLRDLCGSEVGEVFPAADAPWTVGEATA